MLSSRFLAAPAVKELRDAIDRGEIVWVLGTGVTIACTERPDHEFDTRTWRGLLLHAIGECQAFRLVTASEASVMRDALDSTTLDRWLEVAERVTTALGGYSGGDFAAWIEKAVGRLRITDSSLIEAIADSGGPVLTTNYDTVIEAVTRRGTTTWRDAAQAHRALRGTSRDVLHVHGVWKRPEDVILGISSYERVTQAPAIQTLLQAAFAGKTIVFVGCGDGLGDPNFGALMTWCEQHLLDSPFRHYRLCLESEVDPLIAKYPPFRFRVYPLPFGEEFAELPSFIRALSPAHESEGAGPTPRNLVLDARRASTMLFTILNRDTLDGYYARTVDEDFAMLAANGSVWLWGESGVGKTSTIRRHLLASDSVWHHCCLANLVGTPTPVDALRAIGESITSASGNHTNWANVKTVPDLVQLLAEQVTATSGDSPIAIYIDELPVLSGDSLSGICEALAALMSYQRVRWSQSQVRFFLSTIGDPRQCIASRPGAIKEHLTFMELRRWTATDTRGLVDFILAHLSIPACGSAERTLIVEKSRGSPRWVKQVLRMLHGSVASRVWTLERILDQVGEP